MKSFKRHIASRAAHLAWDSSHVEHLLKEDIGHQIRIENPSRYPKMTSLHRDDLHVHKILTHKNHEWEPNRRALSEYKEESEPFNDHLRNLGNHTPEGIVAHRLPHRHEQMQRLDEATSNGLRHPLSAYRGFSVGFPIHHLVPGHEFVDHGYTSTSLSMEVARAFTGAHGKGSLHDSPAHKFPPKSRTLAMIHMPKGTKGLYVDHPDGPEFGLSHEHEFIMGRGTKFRVMGHSRFSHREPSPFDNAVQHTHIVHLQAVGQEPKKLLDRVPPPHVREMREIIKSHGFRKSFSPQHLDGLYVGYDHPEASMGKINHGDPHDHWTHSSDSGVTFASGYGSEGLKTHLQNFAALKKKKSISS